MLSSLYKIGALPLPAHPPSRHRSRQVWLCCDPSACCVLSLDRRPCPSSPDGSSLSQSELGQKQTRGSNWEFLHCHGEPQSDWRCSVLRTFRLGSFLQLVLLFLALLSLAFLFFLDLLPQTREDRLQDDGVFIYLLERETQFSVTYYNVGWKKITLSITATVEFQTCQQLGPQQL